MEKFEATVLDRLQKFLIDYRRLTHDAIPRIVCEDGFSMSLQVGETSYCEPRSDSGPWDFVEIVYPSQIEPLLWKYAQDPNRWTRTVYPWVPIWLAAVVIEVHGGIKEETLQKTSAKF
jgi:hypothetical protein